MSALLALFLRSLRVEARSILTYGLRLGLGLAVLVVIIATHVNTGWRGAPGLNMFRVVIFIDLFVISVAGLSYFASAVAEEKDETTLGLLRMTNLSPLSILLGKSTSRLVGALLLLAVQVPFTMLAVALGGVTVPQVVAAYADLGAYLFVLANLALVFSVVAARTSSATFFAGCALVFFWGGPAVIKGVHWVLGRLGIIASPTPGETLGAFLDGWWQATPVPRLRQILQTGFHDGPWCPQVTMSLMLGMGFFLLAWALFYRGADRGLDQEPARRLASGTKASPGGIRGRRAWRHALVWKDFYFLTGGKIGFAVRCAVCLALVALFAWKNFFTPAAPPPAIPMSFTAILTAIFAGRYGSPWFDFGHSLTTWAGFALWLELPFAASRFLRLEHRWQTLPSLATLPISLHRLVWQKALGCLLGALPWLILVVSGYACMLPDWLNPDSNASSPTAGMVIMGTGASWLQVWSAILGFIASTMLITIVATLSLRLKWGALPVGFVCCYFVQGLLMVFAMLIFQMVGLVIIGIVECAVVAGLYVFIIRRIEELAAEE